MQHHVICCLVSLHSLLSLFRHVLIGQNQDLYHYLVLLFCAVEKCQMTSPRDNDRLPWEGCILAVVSRRI